MACKNKNRVEFGDFQTPLELARKVCALLQHRGIRPASILEPTCGQGAFLRAALEGFADVEIAIGVELNNTYLEHANRELLSFPTRAKIEILHGNFFTTNWNELLRRLPDPLLIIGNPPWVTNAELGSLGSSNLPRKKNEDNLSGMDALTGKSNFDISEWMIRRNIEWLNNRVGSLAILCKTAVARKVLYHAWRKEFQLANAAIYRFDASTCFGASVDACVLIANLFPGRSNFECDDYEDFNSEKSTNIFALSGSHLVSNLGTYKKWSNLETNDSTKWRSGIKHDCSRVFELIKEGHKYRNGLGDMVELEPDVVFPMLKGSDLANGRVTHITRRMLVPQSSVGEDTKYLRTSAPKTWKYLEDHAHLLERRRSVVYKKSPRYAIFGVGEYTFTSWKVAICSLYKRLSFKIVGPHENRPVVFDDTCYFYPCKSEEEAREITYLLNSNVAKEFFSSIIFWDAKRPITAQILNRLNLIELAQVLNHDLHFIADGIGMQRVKSDSSGNQKSLFPLDSAGGL